MSAKETWLELEGGKLASVICGVACEVVCNKQGNWEAFVGGVYVGKNQNAKMARARARKEAKLRTRDCSF